MEIFLKVLLTPIAAGVVIKLLSVLLVIGGVGMGGLLPASCFLGAAIGGLAALGLPVAAAVVVAIVAVALSPISVQIAVVLGIIAPVKKLAHDHGVSVVPK